MDWPNVRIIYGCVLSGGFPGSSDLSDSRTNFHVGYNIRDARYVALGSNSESGLTGCENKYNNNRNGD